MTDSPETPNTPEPEESDAGELAEELYVEDILDAPQDPEASGADGDQVAGSSEDSEEPTDGTGSDLLDDLRRVTAEYANYRKRVEANRATDIEQSMRAAAMMLLPILDDLDRAEKHGDLQEESAFAQIATKMRQVAERLGLAAFGVAGEAFDPNRHEAILQQPSADVTSEVLLEVVEVGYTIGSTLVRAAKVVVAVPQ